MALNLAIIGPGLVGKEFMRQVLAFNHPHLKLSIIGAINSKKMVLGPISSMSNDLFEVGKDADMDRFLSHCQQNLPCVVVDCTSSEYVASLYPKILSKMSIVTPNKRGFSSSLVLYRLINRNCTMGLWNHRVEIEPFAFTNLRWGVFI